MLRVVTEWIDSRALAGNALGDPARRQTSVILPPSYDDHPDRRYPVLLVLAPFSSTGWHLLSRSPLGEALDERLERLYAQEDGMRECIVVLPDCFTALGGSQYVNSPVLGHHEDHLVQEVLPLVDRHYRTLPRRAVVGRSSGGFGAMWLAMNHPDLFCAVGCHAGDSAWRVTLIPELLKFCRCAQRHGGPRPLLDHLLALGKGPRSGELFDAMMILAYAAAYSPDAASPLGFALPICWESGALDEEVFRRWLRYDPVEICQEEPYRSALRRMQLIFLDAGTRDEYHLDLGMRQLAVRLRAIGARVLHEEFEGGHMGTTYRLDRSLPLLARVLAEGDPGPVQG
ncbi:MAG: alpha/beta hydrolase-fold protein [Myxococcales bacterium]|nr:esterase family protein [Myxococcota bacterium]MDW8281386.1 alpha/beta hydrolase-fold protein [Myxococcales bacterium]